MNNTAVERDCLCLIRKGRWLEIEISASLCRYTGRKNQRDLNNSSPPLLLASDSAAVERGCSVLRHNTGHVVKHPSTFGSSKFEASSTRSDDKECKIVLGWTACRTVSENSGSGVALADR